jgi:hypothetical protein
MSKSTLTLSYSSFPIITEVEQPFAAQPPKAAKNGFYRGKYVTPPPISIQSSFLLGRLVFNERRIVWYVYIEYCRPWRVRWCKFHAFRKFTLFAWIIHLKTRHIIMDNIHWVWACCSALYIYYFYSNFMPTPVSAHRGTWTVRRLSIDEPPYLSLWRFHLRNTIPLTSEAVLLSNESIS